MPYVATRDDRQLYVRVVGRGQPVLVLSGLGMHSAHWLPFLAPFVDRFRFFLPDFRGFGRSAAVPLAEDDVFESHARDVVDVRARLGLEAPRLIGYSLGGTTALHLQRDHGFDGVRAYLHVDQSPCVRNREGWSHGLLGERQPALVRVLGRLHGLLEGHPAEGYVSELPRATKQEVAASLAELAALFGGSGLAPALRRVPFLPTALVRGAPLARIGDARAYAAGYSTGGHDYLPALRGCETPITVMVGMRSTLYAPEGQMAIAEHAANARVVRMERSGHVPLFEQPIEFVRELGRFLERR